MNDPLIDISTVIERPTVAIDGTRYEILSPDELSVLDSHRLAAWGRRYDALVAKDAPTPDEDQEMSDLVISMSKKIMVGVPEEVRAKLTDAMRQAVIEVFSVLPLGRRLGRLAGAVPATASRSIGARPSLGSSASTAGGPDGGSRRPPSISSEPTS